jgi:hypothetical protein
MPGISSQRPKPRLVLKRKRKFTSRLMRTLNDLAAEGVVAVIVDVVTVDVVVIVAVTEDPVLMVRR